MLFKWFSFISILLFPGFYTGSYLTAQTNVKKIIDHSVYEDWKSMKNIRISNNGSWAVYEVNPNQGDGVLHLVRLSDRTKKTFERGYDPEFSPESDYLVFAL